MLKELTQIIEEDLLPASVKKEVISNIDKIGNFTELETDILVTLLIKDKSVSIQQLFGLRKIEQVSAVIEALESLEQQEIIDIRIVSEKTVFIDCKYGLEGAIKEKVDNAIYPKPLIIKPKNISSVKAKIGLSSDKESIFTRGHDPFRRKTVPLNVINILQQTAFTLDEVVCSTPERNKKLFTKKQIAAEEQHNEETKKVVDYLMENGNEFYFKWKYCHRGRMYPSGYHINPQGTEYKKAMLNLK